MTENLVLALQITVLGMGLVFGAIVLLWAAMALLMRVTVQRAVDEKITAARERKQRAALAGVAVALAQQASTDPQPFPLPTTAFVSAWQAVTRANLLNRRNPSR